MSLKELFGDREFYAVMLKVALPIAAQSLVLNALNAVDVLLIGQLGETSVASVALANQFTFLLQLFLFGIASGAGIFTAQFWGKGDIPSLRRTFGLGLGAALAGSLLFTAVGLAIPERVLRLYTSDPTVIALGAPFLRIVALSYVINSLTVLFAMTLRTIRQVRLPMIVSIAALTLKTALAYVLIFGYFGLPALGILGAAIATLVARILECAVLLTLVYRWQLPPALRLADLSGYSHAFLARFAATTLPVILTEVVWSVGVSIYTAIYARIGVDSVAAFNIASTIEGVAIVPFMGMGNACAIIVGNALGAQDTDTARDYARKFLALAMVGALAMGLAIFAVSRVILDAYNISAESADYARRVMIVMAAVLWIRAANMVIIIGILRSGGDTRFGLLVDAGPMWLLGIPLAMLAAFVLHLPVYLVYPAVILGDETVKFLLGLYRFRSQRWMNIVVGSEG